MRELPERFAREAWLDVAMRLSICRMQRAHEVVVVETRLYRIEAVLNWRKCELFVVGYIAPVLMNTMIDIAIVAAFDLVFGYYKMAPNELNKMKCKQLYATQLMLAPMADVIDLMFEIVVG